MLLSASTIKTEMAKQEDVFKTIVAHAKEYGFVFQSSEIYDGMSAVYDYGQNGVELKKQHKTLLVGGYDDAPRQHRGY